jgi:ATP-dependent Clp protease ATP-binding subunit ClpA
LVHLRDISAIVKRALLSQETLNQHHSDKIKVSLVLFDEIEKASDALWNLLLVILDKGVLTLGDNQRVDFSSTIIFMTSNLGANEMSSLSDPRLGFQAPVPAGDAFKEELNSRMSRIGVAAARRRFTPEFMNRLDKIVVFKPYGSDETKSLTSSWIWFRNASALRAKHSSLPSMKVPERACSQRVRMSGTERVT